MADLTLDDVAAELSVSSRTVRRLLVGGELAYYRVRRQLRITPDAVTEYKRRHWQSASSTTDLSSSSNREVDVYLDGYRVPRRKPRRPNLKLISGGD